MRLGLLLGFEPTLADVVALARQGEAAGFDSMYTVEAGRTAFVGAAAVINATSRVRVGIGGKDSIGRTFSGANSRIRSESTGSQSVGKEKTHPHVEDGFVEKC